MPYQGSNRAMWVFLASDAMLFAALLAAYAVARHDAPAWPDSRGVFNVPMVWSMTAALAANGVAVKQGRLAWVLAAMALGCGFLAMQAIEWSALIAEGAGLKGNPWGVPQFTGYFFLITGLHGLHVLSGVIVLGIVALRGVGLALATLYWHFIGVIWLCVLVSLYLL